MRRRTAALIGLATGVVALGALVAVAGTHPRRALDDCAATRARELSRVGTSSRVDWRIYPFLYNCVYTTPEGRVVTTSPPSSE